MEDNFSLELKVIHRNGSIEKNSEVIIRVEVKLWKVKKNFVF